jgi:hypothetical protein
MLINSCRPYTLKTPRILYLSHPSIALSHVLHYQPLLWLLATPFRAFGNRYEIPNFLSWPFWPLPALSQLAQLVESDKNMLLWMV